MNTPQGWSSQLESTWLADRHLLPRIHDRVLDQLRTHRGLKPTQAATTSAFTIRVGGEWIRKFGADGHWFWCTTAMVLTTELLVCAEAGGTWKEADIREWDKDVRRDLQVLLDLRNAICHPAHQLNVGSGQPHVEELIRYFENNDDQPQLAVGLSGSWAFLGERPISEFALRKLDAVGREFARRHRLGDRGTRSRSGRRS